MCVNSRITRCLITYERRESLQTVAVLYFNVEHDAWGLAGWPVDLERSRPRVAWVTNDRALWRMIAGLGAPQLGA